MNEALTMVEAAQLLGLSERTIRRAVKAGQLSADLSNPKKARIRRDDLEAWNLQRQRHIEPTRLSLATPEAQSLLLHIQELEQRSSHLAELEQRVQYLEHQADVQRHKVKPVNLVGFAALHNVAASEYRRAITMGVLPVVRQDEMLLLDGKGQQAFWRALHELPSFRSCEACPH